MGHAAARFPTDLRQVLTQSLCDGLKRGAGSEAEFTRANEVVKRQVTALEAGGRSSQEVQCRHRGVAGPLLCWRKDHPGHIIGSQPGRLSHNQFHIGSMISGIQ